jgi:hypothetical protein
MATLSRAWHFWAAAVTLAVALPVVGCDVLLLAHVARAFGRISGSLP